MKLALVLAGFIAPFVALGVLHPDPWGAVHSYAYLTPVAFFAAMFANMTAVGGGFLFVPVFVFTGVHPLVALKVSLGTQAVGMSSGSLGWSRECIDGRALLTGTAAALVGMALGTLVWTPSALQVKATFGWVSILIGIVMAIEFRFGDHTKTPRADGGVFDGAIYAALCVAGGLITSWISIGIGEVVALWLLFRRRLPMEIAIGTGVAALALCSIAGFAMHAGATGTPFPWTFLAFTVPGVMLGGFAGARGGRRLERSMRARGKRSPLKAIFAGVVLLDGIVMLLHAGTH